MYNTKNLRTVLMNVLTTAAGAGWHVSYAVDPNNSPRFVVFAMQELLASDGRWQFELEVNVVGPLSDCDSVEAVSDAITTALDHKFCLTDNLAVYSYHSTRNRIIGKDPHTVRFRSTFDSYLYERN